MVTIRDVAKRASVSVATVSHVMNESRFVKPETITSIGMRKWAHIGQC